MRKLIILSFFCLFGSLAGAQDSLNMRRNAVWAFSGATAYNDCWGYAANGREYAILGSNWGTHFLDITNPEQPVVVGNFIGKTSNVIWRDFDTYGHYAYGVADGAPNSLQIFDLQYLPDSVVKVYDNDSLTRSAHTMYINGNRLYLSSNTRGLNFYSMEILSIANPTAPTLLGTLNNGGLFNETHDLYAVRDTVFFSGGAGGTSGGGLFIYDYRNPAAPVLISSITSYPEKGYNHSNWVSANRNKLVFADETHGAGLKLYDISNISNPVLQGVFRSNTGAIAHNPYIRGDSVYISYYHDGVRVFSIADSSNISQVAYYDTYPGNVGYPGYQGVWSVYPYLPSKRILASDMSTGLHILTLLPVTTKPQVNFNINSVEGCGPYKVNLFNGTVNAATYQWKLLLGGNQVSTFSGQNPSITLSNPGNYQLRLVATNSIGTDSITQSLSVGQQSAIPVPSIVTFNNNPLPVCLERKANSDILVSPNTGLLSTPALEFRGGEGTNFVTGLNCQSTFTANPDYVAKAGLRVNVQNLNSLSMIYYLRFENLNSAPDPSKSNFRIKVNGQLTGVCDRSQSQSYLSNTLDLSPYLSDPGDTLYIEFEAANRFFRPANFIFDRIYLENLNFSGTLNTENTLLPAVQVDLFPNPASGTVTLQCIGDRSQSIPSYKLYDLQGRASMEGMVDQDRKELSVDHLANGMYLIEIVWGSRLQQKTLMIQK